VIHPRQLSWLALGLIAGGCGGGGGASLPTPSKGGQAVFSVRWPVRTTRLIPAAANSLVVTIAQNGTTVATKTIPRPSGNQTSTSTTLTDLPYGTLQVAVAAYPTTNGTGTAQANGTASMAVTNSTPGSVTVSLASTVARIDPFPAQSFLPLGQTESITASAFDADGNMVLLAAGGGSEALSWRSSNHAITVSGTGPTATLKANVNDSATITATMKTADNGSTVSGETPIWTQENVQLAQGGFPKAYANLANNGQTQVQAVPGGTVAWSSSAGLGSSVEALIVGPDETIYAGGNGKVAAISSSGNVKWTASVDGGVYGLLLTQQGELLVGAQQLSVLNSRNGALNWSFATDSPCYEPNVSADGTTIYQATRDSVYAISVASHTAKWQWSPPENGGPLGSVVVVGNGTLACRNRFQVYELNPEGSVVGTLSAHASSRVYSVIADASKVYVLSISGRAPSTVYYVYLAANTAGTVLWETSNLYWPNAAALPSLSPAGDIAGQGFVVNAGNGAVSSFPLAFRSVAIYSTGGEAFAIPQSGNGNVVQAFSSDSGSVFFSTQLSLTSGSFLSTSPAIGPSGRVYIGGGDGSISAIE